jgi:hypothetical protein
MRNGSFFVIPVDKKLFFSEYHAGSECPRKAPHLQYTKKWMKREAED